MVGVVCEPALRVYTLIKAQQCRRPMRRRLPAKLGQSTGIAKGTCQIRQDEARGFQLLVRQGVALGCHIRLRNTCSAHSVAK